MWRLHSVATGASNSLLKLTHSDAVLTINRKCREDIVNLAYQISVDRRLSHRELNTTSLGLPEDSPLSAMVVELFPNFSGLPTPLARTWAAQEFIEPPHWNLL